MITVIYMEPGVSRLQFKAFSSQSEVDKFLEDPRDEVCPSGETMSYIIVFGEATLKHGIVDKT